MRNLLFLSRQPRRCRSLLLQSSNRSFTSTHPRNFHQSRSSQCNWNPKLSPSPPSPSSLPPPTADWKQNGEPEYKGPSNTIIRVHKTVHMSLMTLFTVGSPCLLHAVSAFPSTFQAAILGTGAACFGVVTVYIALSTGPYVAYLRWLPKEEGKKIEGIDMVTYTWLLQKRITRVYNPGFLVDSDKPFTTWKLARRFQLPPFVAHIVKPGQEEVVAETFDRCGKVLGRWIVTWGEDGRGYCRGEGNIQRFFGVHVELLPRPVRWGPR